MVSPDSPTSIAADSNGTTVTKRDVSQLHRSGNGGRIEQTFSRGKEEGKAVLITFVTAGFPTPDDTIPAMLAMQEGGATLIELGVPYTDPQADGATIQHTNQVALKKGTASIDACLSMVSRARDQGLSIPVVFMGYYNPFYQYGVERLCK